MSEIWKPINGFEDRYLISNLGNVKSLHNNKKRRDKILKPTLSGKKYLAVELIINRERKCITIHRLVALAFIPNDDPVNKSQVNHIDGNKLNNRWDNLEWSTMAENLLHYSELKKEYNKLKEEVMHLRIKIKRLSTIC